MSSQSSSFIVASSQKLVRFSVDADYKTPAIPVDLPAIPARIIDVAVSSGPKPQIAVLYEDGSIQALDLDNHFK